MTALEWKIYYGDGSTFSSEDGPPDDAPTLDVQVVAQRDETVGTKLVPSKDFYWWRDGRWYGGDLFGLFDHLVRHGGCVKFGRYISDERYHAAMRRAKTDLEAGVLPRKSAVHSSEVGHVEI